MALPYEFKAETLIKEGRTSQIYVDEVKNWLKTTSLHQLQDEFIVLLLLSCENDVRASKDTLRNYFKIKKRAPDMFSSQDIDHESLKRARQLVICCSLPKRLNNTVIHLYRLQSSDYKNFVLADIFKLAFMTIAISQRYCPPDNQTVVIDMEGITVMHLTCIKLGVLKSFIDFVQDAILLRIKKVHILNVNYIAEKALGLAKLFMKKELVEVLEIHPTSMDIEAFHKKHIPPTHLPEEYGGDLPSYMKLNNTAIQDFRELKAFFKAEENLIENCDLSNLPN